MSFFDTDFGSPIPWMADTEVDEWCRLEINVKSLTEIEVTVPFGKTNRITEATADMRNVRDHEGDEIVEAGEHTVPFWACAQLQVALADKQKSKWVSLRYKRSIVMRKGKENSLAEFVED